MDFARAALRCSLTLLALGVAGTSCSTAANPGAGTTDAGAPGPSCRDLVRICHYADFGEPGLIHDCHSWGHEGPESTCTAEHDRCEGLCAAKLLELGIDEHGKALDAGADARADAGSDTGSEAGATDAGAHHDAAAHDSGHVVEAAPPVPTDATLSGEEQCFRLGNICHQVDPGSGPIHDCHNIGHDEVIPDCVANYARCISICTNASP